ncbi:MAG: hypothetical protein V3S68_04870 [Dehalococcoidia bacterium]
MSPNTERQRARMWAGVVLTGILAILALEAYALSLGINGTALTASVAALAALTGAGVGRMAK